MGPQPGGYFWALKECNDLHSIHVQLDTDFAFLHATVYMQNAEKQNGWNKISDSKELEIFKSVWEDDSVNKCFHKYVTPYTPEFYIVPYETIEGFKIRIISEDRPQRGDTVNLYCPHCKETTLWDCSESRIECLYCYSTHSFG